MSAHLVFLVLGVGQAIIFGVMLLFVKRAVEGRPSLLLRSVVALIGLIAVAFFGAAGWLAVAAP